MNEHTIMLPHKAVCHLAISLAAALALLMTAGSATQAQTADAGAADSVIQVFRHPSGVEIHILQLKPGIGDDEMIEALKSAARLLRLGKNVKPASYVETVPPEALSLPPGPEIETPTSNSEIEAPPPAPKIETPPPKPEIEETLPAPKIETPPPQAALPETPATPPTVAAIGGDTAILGQPEAGFLDQFTLTGLPATKLWQPPLANALQPRLALNMTSLDNSTTTKTIDTAIGGEVGLYRIASTECPGLLFEPDFFAVVLSRFSDNSAFTAADFRFGFPLTFAYENWHAKIGYEHTSTHLGDDYIMNTGQQKAGNIRDECVCGLDYVLADQLRFYGVFAYAAYITTPTNSPPTRYDMGVEWSMNQTTDWRGQPFAAFDMEFRGDQNYTADMTLQLGWQWKEMDSGHSFRLGTEVYDGRSPYGQFYLTREKWVEFGVWIDY